MDYIPPKAFNAPVVEERRIDYSFSTSTLINTLWGEKAPIMHKILQCESGMRQYDSKGNPLMSKTDDVGIAQIHIGKYANWAKKSIELGYDLTKTEDNIVMAYYIWNKQGFKAWSCYKQIYLS